MKHRLFASRMIGCAIIGLSMNGLGTSQVAAQAADPAVVAPAPDMKATPAKKRRVVRRIKASLRGAAPGATIGRVNPDVLPGAVQAPAHAQPKGPLAPIGAALENAGVTLHLFEVETYYNNLNSGIIKNSSSNTAFFVAGADFDMARIAGIRGGTVHIQEQLFHGEKNVLSTGERFGGLTSGYEPVFNPTDNQLSLLTYEQSLANDKLDIEVGRTEALRAFLIPICPNLVSCWNDVVEQDARTRTAHTATWGGRVAYKLTPALYVQAGAYEDNPHADFEHGFNFDSKHSTGAVILGEVGYKTDYTSAKFPERYEFVGYYNTSATADPFFSAYGRSAVLNPGDPVRMNTGNGGLIIDGIKTIWRADGGRENNLHPTALDAYASVSAPFSTGSLVSLESYVGLTLMAPFQSRPFDTIGAKIHYTQLSSREQAFLQDSNLAAGGSGYHKSRNGFEFELSSHNQIGDYLELNTTIQYFANNNNFYNPTSTRVSSDGFYFGMDASVPIGQLVGLSSLAY